MDKQPDITQKHRLILIDWLTEVGVKFKLLSETLFLAVAIVDRFLERKAVTKDKLQVEFLNPVIYSLFKAGWSYCYACCF